MSNKVTELAKKYKAMLSGEDPIGYGRGKHHVTLIFVEMYIVELSEFTLDEQEEFIRIAEADPRWFVSLNGQWMSPVRMELNER